MSKILSDLLFYPFDKASLELPKENEKSLFINCEYTNDVSSLKNVSAVQHFKPYADTWERHGVHSTPTCPNDTGHDFVFCTLPKQKEHSKALIAKCLQALQEKGTLVISASNDANGNRLEKWITALGLNTQSLSKKKSRIVWATKNDLNQQIFDEYLSLSHARELSIGDYNFHTMPGIYGWKNIDQGSQLLINALDQPLKGNGADFGCGYGYLSTKILKQDNVIKKLYTIDADYNALECCKKNLGPYTDTHDIQFLWHDLNTRPDTLAPLDFAVMNPPFHEGKKTSNDIGKNFIKTAHQSLRNSGQLYMVANVHLPYELLLGQLFKKVEKLTEKSGFKVFKATK